MNTEAVKKLLEQVKSGHMPVDRALDSLKDLPYQDLGYAMVDHHRALRSGHPETIFSEGKTVEQVVGIARRLLEKGNNIMATRANRRVYEALQSVCDRVEYHESARIVVMNRESSVRTRTTILVMCAGTSDIPVAEEAAVTAETMGNRVERVYDVGVAGIHRLFTQKSKLDDATIAKFQRELGAMGYKFQFITLAGWHALNSSMFRLSRAYKAEGMYAYSLLQQREFADEQHGFRAAKHQSFVGAGYFDAVQNTIMHGLSSTGAMEGSTEEEQFVA